MPVAAGGSAINAMPVGGSSQTKPIMMPMQGQIPAGQTIAAPQQPMLKPGEVPNVN